VWPTYAKKIRDGGLLYALATMALRWVMRLALDSRIRNNSAFR
jgi:hypothetical protein